MMTSFKLSVVLATLFHAALVVVGDDVGAGLDAASGADDGSNRRLEDAVAGDLESAVDKRRSKSMSLLRLGRGGGSEMSGAAVGEEESKRKMNLLRLGRAQQSFVDASERGGGGSEDVVEETMDRRLTRGGRQSMSLLRLGRSGVDDDDDQSAAASVEKRRRGGGKTMSLLRLGRGGAGMDVVAAEPDQQLQQVDGLEEDADKRSMGWKRFGRRRSSANNPKSMSLMRLG